MTIHGITTINGPNVYHECPVLVMKLGLDELEEVESVEIEGFNEHLLELLPGLAEHHCGLGRPGGFVERLRTGTWFGHIAEHVAIELSGHAGIGVSFGKTRYDWYADVFNVIVTYKAEHGMRFLLEKAVEIVDALAKGDDVDLPPIIAQARRVVAETELGPSTRAIVEAAGKRGIPWARIGDGSLVQFGYGIHTRRIQAAMTCRTSAVGTDVACDKQLAREVLERASVPVPRGRVASGFEDVITIARELDVPIVVKPLDGSQGNGVTIGPETDDEMAAAYAHARAHGSSVVVEEFVWGRNYRVLVVNGKMVAAAERTAPQVIGDGDHTIEELVAMVNEDPCRGQGHECSLTRIRIDQTTIAFIAKSGRALTDVPDAGEVVALRDGLNLSTGGTARDVTDDVHETVRIACERAARAVDLDLCGIDIILPDIGEPLRHDRGAVIEVNAAPGLRMHLQPSEGKPRDVGGAIIEMLYPANAPSRVPIISVTGTNGKTTVTRLIAHVMATRGHCVGATTTDGIEIGGKRIAEGDMTGPHSARTVLSDPTVDFAVLETARGGIVRRGLGYDWSDVAVLTNIQHDHFGQDGIRDADDLLFIKSLVAERVRRGGVVVLNADDPMLAALPQKRALTDRRIVYFSMDVRSARVAAHCEAGGTALTLSDGWIVLKAGRAVTRIVPVENVPLTFGGWARHQIANVLAASAACLSQGITPADLATALRSFTPSRQNPGRGAFFKLPEGVNVLIDYGHNPEALRATAALTRHWGGPVTAILGAPGDRTNALISEIGAIAARAFDRVVLVEDNDLRGRRPGEIATLLCSAVKQTERTRECIIVLDQVDALESELRRAKPHESIVIFYENLEPVLAVMGRFGAVPRDPSGSSEDDSGAASRNGVDRAPAPREGHGESIGHIARSA